MEAPATCALVRPIGVQYSDRVRGEVIEGIRLLLKIDTGRFAGVAVVITNNELTAANEFVDEGLLPVHAWRTGSHDEQHRDPRRVAKGFGANLDAVRTDHVVCHDVLVF